MDLFYLNDEQYCYHNGELYIFNPSAFKLFEKVNKMNNNYYGWDNWGPVGPIKFSSSSEIKLTDECPNMESEVTNSKLDRLENRNDYLEIEFAHLQEENRKLSMRLRKMEIQSDREFESTRKSFGRLYFLSGSLLGLVAMGHGIFEGIYRGIYNLF